jgi:hypothetical protein
MKTNCATPDKVTISAPSSPAADTRRSAKSQFRVRTSIRAGYEATKHAAKVTVPDIKL